MAKDVKRARRKIREVAARLGVSEVDVYLCSADYLRAVKRENEAKRIGVKS